jgi:WhiB family transcriptional regulator, redox-sensing transcriptional regulator
MAEPDLDYQFTNPGSPTAAAPDPFGWPGSRMAALPANRTVWMLRGACRREDPELFFPISASGPARVQISAAKAVCARCSVRANCLSYALITQPDASGAGPPGKNAGPIRRQSVTCRRGGDKQADRGVRVAVSPVSRMSRPRSSSAAPS